jgi:hypothetical protein
MINLFVFSYFFDRLIHLANQIRTIENGMKNPMNCKHGDYNGDSNVCAHKNQSVRDLWRQETGNSCKKCNSWEHGD